MDRKMLLGSLGENYVCNYLQSHNFDILQRNYHSRYGEIDIIASDGKYLTFTEVKTRSENPMYSPCEAVTKSKQNKIIKTALLYMMNNKHDLQPRFDVAEVIIKKSTNEIIGFNYIKNAFIGEEDYGAF